MKTVAILIFVLAALYILALRGRVGHPGLKPLRDWNYAHRGLHGAGVPENSMAAFRAALENGYGIELDIHLLKDGNLAVIHDSTLKRTTGAEGKIEDLTTEELKNYRLEGTNETIPTFREVLDLFAGKAPMIIELKAVGSNAGLLAQTAVAAMEGYNGLWCMESFDPRCILWLKKHRPDIIRGQLTENYFTVKGGLPWILKVILTHQIGNFLSRPDFIAYRFKDRKTISNTICRGLWGMQGVSWTLRSPEEYDAAVSEGWIPIFENFRP